MAEDHLHINATSFEKAFKQHYVALFHFAYQFVQRTDIAEELVQEVFVLLWEKRKTTKITSSLKSYLYTAVRNQCLNYLKEKWHKKELLQDWASSIDLHLPESVDDSERLYQLIQLGIKRLPEKCRLIFNLSRQSGLSYDEIAQELNISKETVKSQIKIALQKLRTFLGEHWDTLAISILLWS